MRVWPALDVRAHGSEWDLIQAALTDFDVAAIDETAPPARRVFFHTADRRDLAAAALRRDFTGASVAAVDVLDEDWAARSQSYLRAVRVGHLIVAPPWDVPASPGATTVVIQPSMGFGTGHHATTRLCLAHLQALDLRGRTVLDLGTGSGVLAIAASRLGALDVLAIDDDPDAIASARENASVNAVANVTFAMVDFRLATGRKTFDVVLANLTGAVLIGAAGSIHALAGPQARLILSGFGEGEASEVLTSFASCTIERRSQEDEWVCVTLLRSH